MEKMEDLQLEFEAAVEQDGKLACFLTEVEENVASLASFQKAFLKFQLQVETLLKKALKT